MLRSSMVASLMWPAFTSLMKSEYAIGVAPDARLRLSNCLKTINSTRAITTQMAALENMLITRTPPTRARLITLYISDFTRIHLRLLGNRPSLADVNRLRQTGGETRIAADGKNTSKSPQKTLRGIKIVRFQQWMCGRNR